MAPLGVSLAPSTVSVAAPGVSIEPSHTSLVPSGVLLVPLDVSTTSFGVSVTPSGVSVVPHDAPMTQDASPPDTTAASSSLCSGAAAPSPCLSPEGASASLPESWLGEDSTPFWVAAPSTSADAPDSPTASWDRSPCSPTTTLSGTTVRGAEDRQTHINLILSHLSLRTGNSSYE